MEKRSAFHRLSFGIEAGGLHFAYPPDEDWHVRSALDP
jgi:hypothetical protein